MKFAKPFLGVPNGEIYPVQYEAGDECPPELESAAIALGAGDAPDDAAETVPADGEAPAPKPRTKK